MISRRAVLLCLTFALAAATTYAQTPALPPFTVEKVTPNVQCLHSLSNVTVLTGPDGLLVVDSGVREQAAELAAKVKETGPQPVRYLVNTHYHFDHTGGNATLGRGATIVAHEGCRRSMLARLKPGEKPEDASRPTST